MHSAALTNPVGLKAQARLPEDCPCEEDERMYNMAGYHPSEPNGGNVVEQPRLQIPTVNKQIYYDGLE